MAAMGHVAVLAQELAEAQLRNNPFEASCMGVSGYDDAVPDLSPQARAAWRDTLVDALVRSDTLEADSGDFGSRVLLAAVRDHAARGLAIADSRVLEFGVAALPMSGPAAMLLAISRTRVADPESAAEYLSRCGKIPAYLDQYGEQLRRAARAGLMPVAPLVRDVIGRLREQIANPARDPLLAHRPPNGWAGAAAWDDELRRIVGDEIHPAVGRYIDVLVELLPRSRPPERAGLLYVPGGVAAYACCIRAGTTLALDADEIHGMGLTALAELEERIAELGGRVLGESSAAGVMHRLRHHPPAEAGSEPAAMTRAAAVIARAEERLPDMFHPPLPSPCLIEPMSPPLAESGAAPMYSPPARNGSRAGAYLFNRSRPGPAGTWALESVTFHETVPGHHAQFARLQLVPDLPLLLSAFDVVPHGEGWGLYAERLADEFGLYSSDLQRLGMLALEAWRAVRLVVDTGLHARGWSRARALEFALAHTPMPEHFIRPEIDRYIVMPGQALGYRIGQREILRLREHARERLGAGFDIRDFHSAILDHGSLPLPVLAQVVDAWLAAKTAA